MKKSAKTIGRHFPYEHPTFGTDKRPKAESAWKKSVYYWWWEYLRRNQEYIECCKSGGKGNLAELYKDFGDVTDAGFKNWWSANDRGALLFADPIVEHTVRKLDAGEPAPENENLITLAIPLNLPKRFLHKRIRDLLAENHSSKRGHQFAKKSRAKYKIQGQPNIPALEQGLMVYDAIKQAEAQGIKRAYWKIAMDLNLVARDKRILEDDPPSTVTDKKNVLTAIVGRYKKRVEESIKSTSLGLFP